jgi:carbamoyl-phosphate synthase large subunit
LSKRLLILRAGSGLTNNVIRSLRAGGPSLFIVGCHYDRFILKKSTADRNYVNPLAEDVFLEALNSIIRRERIDLLIPTSDEDALKISRVAKGLECRTFLPSHSVIEHCQDKYLLTRFLRRKGIPAPLTYRITNVNRTEELFRRLGYKKLWCRIRAGTGSFGAIPVNSPEQVRSWVRYWEEMRGIRPRSFTLSDYLPGRDFGVQSLWKNGTLILTKMAERITYMDSGSPSGVGSMPALAKTVFEPEVARTCEAAIRAIDPHASGVFFIDLKQNAQGEACITEINAGRFAAMTNIFDLTGQHNMAWLYVRLGLDKPVPFCDMFDFAENFFFVRSIDDVPSIAHGRELFENIGDWAN